MSERYDALRALIEDCVRATSSTAAAEVADSVLCGLLNYGSERDVVTSANGDSWTTQEVLELAIAPARQRNPMGFSTLLNCTISSIKD